MPSPDIHMRECKFCDGYILRAFDIAKDNLMLLIVSKDDGGKIYKNCLEDYTQTCDQFMDEMVESTFELHFEDDDELGIIQITKAGMRFGMSFRLDK